ncbi:unnamed protein product [Leptosia nina]|uniref:Uncharacterized protein n=1 Tax=Leptosia nina TaxID=320188 RepID=A0AAV1JEI5_9NEOP
MLYQVVGDPLARGGVARLRGATVTGVRYRTVSGIILSSRIIVTIRCERAQMEPLMVSRADATLVRYVLVVSGGFVYRFSCPQRVSVQIGVGVAYGGVVRLELFIAGATGAREQP